MLTELFPASERGGIRNPRCYNKPMEAFDLLDPKPTPWDFELYHSRRAVLMAIRRVLPLLHGTVLDVGCGRMDYRPVLLASPSKATRYVGLDLAVNTYSQPDLTWDGQTIPLPADSVDGAIATEVLEHCPNPEIVLREVFRVLRPGTVFLLTVPFLWPLHDIPYDEYRYTPFALERLLGNAGFEKIQIRANGGWDASLAQMIALWVRRRPKGLFAQRVLQRLALPLHNWLLKRDEAPVGFSSSTPSTMITGLSATAFKPQHAPAS